MLPATTRDDLRAFTPLPDGRAAPGQPSVERSAAGQWPAVQNWSFASLAQLAPDLPVQLVHGNREAGSTSFETSTFGSYLRSLDVAPDVALYLKEFDLLAALPALRSDLRPAEVFPPRTVRSSSAWIGPSGARTGLHFDVLDNVAVQIIGRKRFFLARPGVVERLGGVASKFDKWARLAAIPASELSSRGAASDDLFVVDLEPGDVLRVPGGWWHEVVNLTAGVLLSGFHGSPVVATAAWLRESSRERMHRLGLLGRDECTCHPARTVGER